MKTLTRLLLPLLLASAVNAQQSAGYIKYAASAAPPPTPTAGWSLFGNASNQPSWIDPSGFTRTFTGSVTASRSYALPDRSITLGDASTLNPLSQFASTTSSQLRGIMSDSTGTAGLVFANTPTLITPVLGVATATSLNGLTLTASTGIFTLTNLKTFTVQNTLTLSATDGSTLAIGTGGTLGSGAYQPQTVLTGTAGQIAVTNSGVGATTVSIPSAMTGINSVTSVALSNLTLGTGTFGTAVTFASASGAATFASTTAATTTATGAIIDAGGLGVAGAIYGGSNIVATSGTSLVTLAASASSPTITVDAGTGSTANSNLFLIARSSGTAEEGYIWADQNGKLNLSAVNQQTNKLQISGNGDVTFSGFVQSGSIATAYYIGANLLAGTSSNFNNIYAGTAGLALYNSAGTQVGLTMNGTDGRVNFATLARTTGALSYFTISAPADTGITTATESIGVNIVGATRTWVDGTVATQREYYFGAPTYNKTTTAATFTTAATVDIGGAPVAGAGVTFTNGPYALRVESGTGLFANALNVGGTAYTYGALPSGATTAGPAITVPGTTYTVTGTNTATAFQGSYFGAPTITDASAGVATDLFNTVFAGPAAVAGSMTATRKHTLGILDATSASSSVIGGLVVATAFGTTATSTAIGGGNINTGGTITSGTTITAGSTITTAAGVTNAAGVWNLGALRTSTALVPSTTQVIQIAVGGTLYSLITCTTNP